MKTWTIVLICIAVVLIAVIVVIAFSRLGFSAGSLFGMSGGAKKKGE